MRGTDITVMLPCAAYSMSTFMGKSWFDGPALDVSAAGVSFVSQARFDGCVALSHWPRGEVERLLPAELELATNASPTPDLHPVVFVFGDLSDGAVIVGRVTLPLGIAYQEFAVAVPFVKYRRGRQLRTYVPRMYSSYRPAVWSGNANYGLAKRPATMRWQGPFFVITGEDGALLLHIGLERGDGWTPASRCELPNFVAMREILAMQVLGRKASGAYVCCYFGWDFGQALVRTADSCVSIDGPVANGIGSRRCPDVAGGTFELRGAIWRLSWPAPCR